MSIPRGQMPDHVAMGGALGLRVSEALALTLEDVGLQNGVLTICAGRFIKYRLVPLHATICRALALYGRRRDALLDQRDALRRPTSASLVLRSRRQVLAVGSSYIVCRRLAQAACAALPSRW